MSQLSLYLDDETMACLREGAEREGVSLSRYAADSIRSHSASGWPRGFFDLYGSINDDTFVAPEDVDSGLDDAVAAFA